MAKLGWILCPLMEITLLGDENRKIGIRIPNWVNKMNKKMPVFSILIPTDCANAKKELSAFRYKIKLAGELLVINKEIITLWFYNGDMEVLILRHGVYYLYNQFLNDLILYILKLYL